MNYLQFAGKCLVFVLIVTAINTNLPLWYYFLLGIGMGLWSLGGGNKP